MFNKDITERLLEGGQDDAEAEQDIAEAELDLEEVTVEEK
jgi:hypothetical protein